MSLNPQSLNNALTVPENIQTRTKEDEQKFQGGGWFRKPNFFKESMKLNQNFQGVRGVKLQKLSKGGAWY